MNSSKGILKSNKDDVDEDKFEEEKVPIEDYATPLKGKTNAIDD